MTLLTNYTRPAERDRGCTFADGYIDAASVVANAGVISGAPTFDNGIVLDGTGDYVTYQLSDPLITEAVVTFCVEFTPQFAAADNVLKRIFHSTSGFTVTKLQDALNNALRIVMDGVIVADISLATYEPYWNVGERSFLCVTSISGKTNAWMNGTHILSNDVSAWAFSNLNDLVVGANVGGGSAFEGTIHSMKVFNREFSVKEGRDYSLGGLFWNYINVPLIDLPMDMENHDPANTQTLDISGNEYNGTLTGSSLKKNTYQTGYDLPGTDEWINLGDNAAFTFLSEGSDAAFSVSLMAKMDDATGFRMIHKRDIGQEEWQFTIAADNKVYINCFDNALGGQIGRLVNEDQTPFEGQWVHYVGVYVGNGNSNGFLIYRNGIRVDNQNSSSGSYTRMRNTTSVLSIGELQTVSQHANGTIARVKIWDTDLTPVQILDLYHRELQSINNI